MDTVPDPGSVARLTSSTAARDANRGTQGIRIGGRSLAGVTPTSNALIAAVVVAGVAWVCLAAWILGDRALHDRRHSRIGRDAELLTLRALDPKRCSWRRLWRVADGDFAAASMLAAEELVRRDSRRLLRAARKSGFSSVHALRTLARGRSILAIDELRAARLRGNPDVVAATVSIAGQIDTPEADAFLIDVLVEGDNPRSRTADQLARGPRVVPALLELAVHADARVRYWALMLLAGGDTDRAILAAALEAAGDSDAQVRAAAARTFGAYEPGEVMLALRRLLADEVFFVRAHAARAVGESGAEPLCVEVAALLADHSWWVRSAAKESLARLGDSGLDATSAMLDSDDGFARDGATEIILALSRSGSTDSRVSTALLEQVAG